MKIMTHLAPVALMVVVLSFWPALADEVTIPYEFQANTTAVAQEVNDNFDAVATAINDNDDRLDEMSSGYVSVSAITAVPRNSTFETNQANVGSAIGRYAVTAGTEYLLAPLFLPDGATITSFSFTCYDNDATYNSSAYLYRDDSTTAAQVVSTSSSSTTLQTVTTTNINYPSVDNSLYGYFVYMGINGTAGSDLVPIRVVVEYTR